MRGHDEMLVRNVTVLHDVTLEPEAIEVRGDLAHAFGWFSCGVGTPDGQRAEWPAHFPMVLRKEPDGACAHRARVHHAPFLTALDYSVSSTSGSQQMRASPSARYAADADVCIGYPRAQGWHRSSLPLQFLRVVG